MNTYVLVVLYSILHQGIDSTPQTHVEMASFPTLERCQAAGKFIETNAIKVIAAGMTKPVTWSCK